IIVLLAFLNTALSTSTQRYLSIYQGKGEFKQQVNVFNSSFILHLVISTIIVFLGLIFKDSIFQYFINVPSERVGTAKELFTYILISVFFIINAVPWNGSLIAHENMIAVSIISLTDTALKLWLSF